MLQRLSFVTVALCSCFAVDATARADGEFEWAQFLGPNRNGISAETGLIDQWPQGGLKEVWRADARGGMSGLAISRGRILTTIQNAGEQSVVCFDAKSGATNWQTPVGIAYKNGQGDGPRATPTVDGEIVLAYTGDGVLVALRLQDGKLLWSHDAVGENGGKSAEYGMASSPLVVGENVIVTAGAPKATLLAYNIKTGNVAWKAGEGDSAGYSSPVLLKVGGQSQIVVFTGSSLIGVSAQEGSLLWRHPYETDYDCNIAVPLAINDHVFISSGENHGCTLLKLTRAGDKFQVSDVWSSQGVKSVMRNEWQTSLLLDGYLYGFDNVGSAGQITHFTCVNATTGERAWQELRFGKGNAIAADGKLFMTTIKGEVILARVSPKGYEEIGRQKLVGMTRQAPALANGFLYIRDAREIVCLSVKKE